jgi:hypothetical protein
LDGALDGQTRSAEVGDVDVVSHLDRHGWRNMNPVPTERDDLDRRLARIAAEIATLSAVSADAREEVVVATEQLVQRRMARLREAVEASRRARDQRSVERRANNRRR